MASDAEITGLTDVPGYKAILKAVLKTQIQGLVEQLATHTDEESVLITANVSDGTISHLGSNSGRTFLTTHDDFKSQFLGFCIKRHHQQTLADPKLSTNTKTQKSCDQLKSNSSHKVQSRGNKQRPGPYNVKSRSVGSSSGKTTMPASSQDSEQVPGTETDGSTVTFIIKQEPKSDDENSTNLTNFVSETRESESNIAHNDVLKNTLSDQSGVSWIEPVCNDHLMDNKTGNGHQLNITQDSPAGPVSETDQQEIDDLLANTSEVSNKSGSNSAKDDKIRKDPTAANDVTDAVESSEESKPDGDEGDSTDKRVGQSEVDSAVRDMGNNNTRKDPFSQNKCMKDNSELTTLDMSDSKDETNCEHSASPVPMEDDDDAFDDVDVENENSVDKVKEISKDNVRLPLVGVNVDKHSVRHSSVRHAESERAPIASYDNLGAAISHESQTLCDINPPSNNDSDMMETDAEKSKKCDVNSQDNHYRVLAIWNEIADDSNDTSSEVLYDLISEKLKHESDKKTSVEESSQTDSELVREKSDALKVETKTLETESVQTDISGLHGSESSLEKTTEKSRSTCAPAQGNKDSTFSSSNDLDNRESVDYTQIGCVESKMTSDDQHAVISEKSNSAKDTSKETNENDSGQVEEKSDNSGDVLASLSDTGKDCESKQINKQNDSVSKPQKAIVIDLENSDATSQKSLTPNKGMKTPSNQTVRKTSTERQSPSISSKAGVNNQSTPGKQNFIDTLISKGVPIIIPDEEEDAMPSPRSSAFKSKSKQYNDQKTTVRSPKVMQQFSPQMPDQLSNVSQRQFDYSSSQQFSDINQSRNNQYSSQGITQQYGNRNPDVAQQYQSQSPSQKYIGQSPSQHYTVTSPTQQYPGQSPSQYYGTHQDKVGPYFSPRQQQLRQRLFSPPKNVKLVTPTDRNRPFAGNEYLMSPRQPSPIRQSFSPPITPTKPKSNIPTKPASQIQTLTLVTGQRTELTSSQPKGMRKSAPRIPMGTTIIIDDEPASESPKLTNAPHQQHSTHVAHDINQQQILSQSMQISNAPHQQHSTNVAHDINRQQILSQSMQISNAPHQQHSTNVAHDINQQQILSQSMQISNAPHQQHSTNVAHDINQQQILSQSIQISNPVSLQTENPSLPVITNVTSIPMLADQTNQPTAEVMSQPLTQQVVYVPVQVISQMPPTNIQDANEKTPIKRERMDDPVLSPSETSEPSSKRLHMSEEDTVATESEVRPNTPSKSFTYSDIEEHAHKITPKVEIDIDDVDGQLPAIQSPQTCVSSTASEHSISDYDNTLTSSLHLKSDVKTFSPPISPSTRRMHPENKKKSRKISGGSKKGSAKQNEATEAPSSKTKQKDFGCGDCGKSFKTKAALNQHFKKHTQDRPFECDVCGKHFSQKAYLKKHIYTHFKENE